MSKELMEQVRARARARGNAIAALYAGAVLSVAPSLAAWTGTPLPENLTGFAVFLAGIALIAWACGELDRTAAVASKKKPDQRGRDAA
jgi:protein-S-isoprenylcysteine O-methyltransferase Ste14